MKEIALELGTNESTLYELLEIERKLTPEIKDLLDTGIISKTSASKIWSKLSEQEQLELLEELGKDKIKEMTIKETEEYINKAKELEESNELLKKSYNDLSKKYEEEKNKEKVVEVEVEKEVDKTDYKTIENLKKEIEGKNKLYTIAKEKEELYKKQLDLYEKDSQKYKDLTRQIELLSKEKDDIGRAVRSATELSGYVYKIETFLKTELAPIKYSRALIDCGDNEVVINNIKQIVNTVQSWCDDMYKQLSINKQNIDYVEVE